MSQESFYLFIVSLTFGAVCGLVLIAFFEREVFAFIDRLVARVRRACGLPS